MARCFSSGPPALPPALVDWEYNAWGGKYPPFDLDNAVPAQVAELTGRRRFTPGIILEGGAIDGNGQGTMLTTEQCLLNPNRNPQLSRADVERYLADYLRREKSALARRRHRGRRHRRAHRRAGPLRRPDARSWRRWKTIRRTKTTSRCETTIERLQTMTDRDGRPLEVIPVPMPRPLFYDDQRLPACY